MPAGGYRHDGVAAINILRFRNPIHDTPPERKLSPRSTRVWNIIFGTLVSILGRHLIIVITVVMVAVAVAAACLLSTATWWFTPVVTRTNIVYVAAVIALLVAIPIVTCLVLVIDALVKSRDELENLSRDLAVARDEACQADAAKSRLLSSVSHELRTPLNAIIGFSEIVKDEFLGPCGQPRYVEYAKSIHSSARHLLQLINDILDLSKIELGARQIDTHSRCELTDVIVEAAKMVSVMAQKAGVTLQVPSRQPPITVEANNRMMQQIFLNLLSNAVKFTKTGGHVSVSAVQTPANGVAVEVADTGVGMTDEELKVAMQPFGQIDSYRSRQYDGTGLGLSLTKAMVELHEGTLTIRSVPGKGTTVAFSIPETRVIRDSHKSLTAL